MYAVCFLYFVFHAVWFLWKSLLLRVSIHLLCFIISNIIGGKVVSAQNYVFYFESDIAKIFQFRPTCSSYDSEIIKKSKRGQKEPAKKVNKCQTWISSVHVWDLLILVYIVRVLCVLKNIDLMSTLSSFRVSCDPITISMLSFTCCNVKYDVIKQILTWRWIVARFVFIYAFIVEL